MYRIQTNVTWAFQGWFWFNSIKINCLFHLCFCWFGHYTFRSFLPRSFGSRFLPLPHNRFFPTLFKFHNELMNFDSKINTIKAREIENKWMTSNQTTKLHFKSLSAKTKEGCIPLSHVNQACMVYKYGGATSCLGKPISAEARSQLFSATWWTIGLWHEIQNRLKNTWFDVVFHADSDSIFFKF